MTLEKTLTIKSIVIERLIKSESCSILEISKLCLEQFNWNTDSDNLIVSELIQLASIGVIELVPEKRGEIRLTELGRNWYQAQQKFRNGLDNH